VAKTLRTKSGAIASERSRFISEVWRGNLWFSRRFDPKSVGILCSFR